MYGVEAYRLTYECFLPPFSIKNLALDPNILPPEFKKQAGRPKTKRIRKGSWKRKAQKCSNCGSYSGHNARGCRQAPLAHSQRQRAQDQQISSDDLNDSDESSSSSSSLDSSSDDGGLDISVRRQLILEHKAEMSRYDKAFARA
jgi:hypothetical protein